MPIYCSVFNRLLSVKAIVGEGKTFSEYYKYVVKHKSAKLLITYAVGKLEGALNISHLILSTSSQRVSMLELVG